MSRDNLALLLIVLFALGLIGWDGYGAVTTYAHNPLASKFILAMCAIGLGQLAGTITWWFKPAPQPTRA